MTAVSENTGSHLSVAQWPVYVIICTFFFFLVVILFFKRHACFCCSLVCTAHRRLMANEHACFCKPLFCCLSSFTHHLSMSLHLASSSSLFFKGTSLFCCSLVCTAHRRLMANTNVLSNFIAYLFVTCLHLQSLCHCSSCLWAHNLKVYLFA